ncbi:pentatricopeptide repeat-containing protein At1g50270-like [Typha latifolia]|uniref:pentatricopeptide repeat-containing protein At1g50270-like n=1 Tax=Typha latifolia TaxID=4733 RepID=UPI003C2D537B
MAKILRSASLSLPGDIYYATLILHQIKSPNISLWNSILRGFCMRSDHERAVSMYTQMLGYGAIPNEHTYPVVLKALSKSEKRNSNQIHAQILKLGFDKDAFVQNSLVSIYAKSGDLGSAREMFDASCHRDLVSWTAMIHGYVENKQEMEGLTLFAKMRSAGFEVDEVVIVSVLKGAGLVANVWLGRCIHGFYVECGRVKWDVYVGSALIDMYGKCGHCDDARKIFEKMPCRNVVSWSALIAGYEQCGLFRDTLSAFQDMLSEGMKPNLVTFTSVLTACAQLGALDQGRWIHGYIDRNKLKLNPIVGTALVDMYAKCGCVDDAFRIFHKLPQKDVYPWTALINGLAMHGRGLECLDLFSLMLKERVRPNDVTFLSVLCACSHCGLVDQGRSYFYNMFNDYGIKPKLEHYGCMVDLLGRAGRLEEALSIVESMPMEPSGAVWGALLGACMIHKDFILGERIGRHLIKIQPHHSGRYAILANNYSLSGKWEEAAHVRKTMKGNKVEKTSGCSWIEVDGFVHEFIALDESHSQFKVVYETLDCVTANMKMEGCAPDIHLCLLAVDAI